MEFLIGNVVVIVDDSDLEYVKSLSLCFYKRKDKYYVITTEGKRLHRLLLGVNDPKLIVDHRNGNTLDNRRCNLRVCVQVNNSRNRSKSKKKYTSKYKGVYWNRGWVSQIRVNYKAKYLGTFKSEEDAALAYNKAAVKYFGEFAKLNEL